MRNKDKKCKSPSEETKQKMRKDGYPEEEELEIIKEWNAIADPFGLIEFIESITWCPDWCISLKGKNVKWFEFHTGGWSGNEEIIEALNQNAMFFTLYWVKTNKGGHYYFKVKIIK